MTTGGISYRPMSSVSIAITGSGGAGVMTAGNILLRAAAIAGCYGFMCRSSGPQIRGGEAAALIRLADGPIEGLDDRFDILLAIDWENLDRFAAEIPLDESSLIVGDPARGNLPAAIEKAQAKCSSLAMKEMAKRIAGGRANMIALGYAGCLVGLPDGAVDEAVRATLGAESATLPASLAAAAAGREAAAAAAFPGRLSPRKPAHQRRWLITGNEATGFGALSGGIRFVAAYPITPATEILEWMSPALPNVGGSLVQAEDELASITMAIGASFGGIPAMTATSGPGFSLMTESLGLAVAAEVPLVVVDVMRGGPSTGIPTKSEQADLNIALYGGHGDAPHVVVAPNSVADCLVTMEWATYLAESLQVPVVVLSDQLMGQARMIMDPPQHGRYIGKRHIEAANGVPYQRYALTESGVSPMAIPGTAGAMYTADGLEHNERGTPSSQAKDHIAQLDKRRRKLLTGDFGVHGMEAEGKGDIAVITWGSCTPPAREAVTRARERGLEAKLISLRLLTPLQTSLLAEALEGVSRILIVEQTHSGQFHRYLRAEHKFDGEVRALHKPGPLPLRPGEIYRHLVEWS